MVFGEIKILKKICFSPLNERNAYKGPLYTPEKDPLDIIKEIYLINGVNIRNHKKMVDLVL